MVQQWFRGFQMTPLCNSLSHTQTRSKTGMAKTEKYKSDDLEIISAGTLYSGPLDKKYWSSSRGKDRYPYPVGYHARRTHNGIAYNMEIVEGPKGPVFTIASADGLSYSGQTPDIAWDSCQKMSVSRMKLSLGKGYSCKIDGVEFFGFKNQFVLRLLRELVGNVNRTTVSSSSKEGALEIKNQTHCTEPCRQPDLVLYLEKPQVRGKRSRKCRISAVESVSSGDLKRSRREVPKDCTAVLGAKLSFQKKYIHNQTSFLSSPSSDKSGIYNKSGSPEASITSKKVNKEEDCVHSGRSSEHLNKEGCHENNDECISSHNCADMMGTMLNEEDPFDRSKDKSTPTLNILEKVEKEGETSCRNAINDLDLCVPDSLDLKLDGTLNSKGASDLSAACLITSDDLKTGSQDIVTSTEHVGSEKSDIDLVEQDITKSMMTVLLPRALPLLKTFNRKKKTTVNSSGISVNKKKSTYKSNKTSPVALLTECSDEKKQGEEAHILITGPGSMEHSCREVSESYNNNQRQMHVNNQCSKGPPYGDIPLMVPDSEDNNQSEKDLDNQLLMVSSAVEQDFATFGRDIHTPIITRLPVTNVFPPPESELVSGTRLHSLHEEHQALSERLEKENYNLSNSGPVCSSPVEKESACPNKEKGDKMFPASTEAKCSGDCILETICTANTELMPPEKLVKEINAEKEQYHTVNTSFSQIPEAGNVPRQCDVPLSESIICRSFRDICVPDTSATCSMAVPDNFRKSSSHSSSKQDSEFEENFNRQPSDIHEERNFIVGKAPFAHIPPVTLRTERFDGTASPELKAQSCGNKKLPQRQDLVELDVSVPLLLDQEESSGNKTNLSNIKKNDSDLTAQTNTMHDSIPLDEFEVTGCYTHPLPILSVLLSMNNDAIYMCVLCGSVEDKQRTLYMYKTPIQGHGNGYPSLIGHASIVFPVTEDSLYREIALEGSCLQFTPDAQYLVLPSCIKTPYCREENISCPCSECTSVSNEKNAVNIVQVKHGYMSVVATLNTADTVHCMLVCEPNYLLAAEESKKLHIWVMNSTWSEDTSESYFPTSDCIDPHIVELKRIPNCSNLVLGHNGFGEFCLWNIAKCMLVSRYSSPSTSLCRFSPISLFTLQAIAAGLDAEEQSSNLMEITTKLFLENENARMCQVEGKDVVIPLVISNTDIPNHLSRDFHMNTLGWRQALLVNNEVILEDILDLRAVAVGILAGCGIIGTCDGHVYMWELSTGAILGNLHQFKGYAVSCIATDDSSSGAFAVAADCQLRVYMQSNEYCNHTIGLVSRTSQIAVDKVPTANMF